ncbi:MAG: hypothetical protein ACFCBU_07010 [Cyanophyceae cyanobacterium]
MDVPLSQSEQAQSLSPIPKTVVDVMSEENWIANLPQLLRYGQDGDYVQVPNSSVLALAERLNMERGSEKNIAFGVNNIVAEAQG